jgi:hypothetical protein
MLKKDKANKKVPKFIIFNVGLHDKSSDPVKTSCRNLMTMMTWVRARFPTIKIYLTEINYSSLLPQAEHSNLNRINKSMTQYKEVNIIPKLDEKVFQTSSSDIHNNEWSEDTANAMLRHWLSYLN